MANLEFSERDHVEKEGLKAEIKVLEQRMSVMQHEHNMANQTFEIEKEDLKETIVDINQSLKQSATRVKILEENNANLTQSLRQAQATIKVMKAEQKMKSKKELKKEAKLKALKELPCEDPQKDLERWTLERGKGGSW